MTSPKDDSPLAALRGRSLLLTQDWSTRELDALLALASRLEALDRAGRTTALLPDQLAYALFFDNSTRTKSAWAGAAARLGMQPVIVDGCLDAGGPRRDRGGDRGDARHERSRPRHPPRPHPGRGQPLHARREAGHRRLPRRDRRRPRRADRQPAVRRRPPDADAGRPALAARAARRPRGKEDRRVLGLLAELRQAAVGAPGRSSRCSRASGPTSRSPSPRATA